MTREASAPAQSVQFEPIDSFLNPASIALIGASPDRGKLRGKLTEFIVKNGYAGDLYFINPTHVEIDGRRCYPSIASLPAAVDLAIIVVPADNVVEAVEQCAASGTRNAVILSSGFAESGDGTSEVQDRIAAIAKRSGMRISGPNAEGFHNEAHRLSATFSPTVDVDASTLIVAASKRVGVIAQSGGIGFSLMQVGRTMGLGFSHVITSGNEADLTVADFLNHLADDADTSVIVLFIESIRNAKAFIAAAERAARARKPVIVMKVGRSVAGGRATASHTGSMAGWGAAYDAMFRQVGMTVVDDPVRALAIAAAFATCPLPRGRRAAVMTVSGGGGALMADALSAVGFELPELSADTQAAIRSFIPSYGATRNPVDVTGQATRTGAPLKVIEMLSSGNEVDMIVAVSTMSNLTRPPVDPEGLRKVTAEQRMPVLFYTYTVASDFGRRSLAVAESIPYLSVADLAAAARALVDFAEFDVAGLDSASSSDGSLHDVHVPSWFHELPDGVQSEATSKRLLVDCGITVPNGALIGSAELLRAAAASFAYPVAVKIQSADIPHKTEAGGVKLNVADAGALAAAFEQVTAAARKHAPDARIEGVLVESMAPAGVEMIVGLVRDDTFGHVLTVGAGGVATELYKDVARRLAPVSADEARALLKQLKSYPLLNGFRGSPPADVDSLAALIARVSGIAAASECEIAEFELNPVIVHPRGQGVTVADAMIVIGRAS